MREFSALKYVFNYFAVPKMVIIQIFTSEKSTYEYSKPDYLHKIFIDFCFLNLFL